MKKRVTLGLLITVLGIFGSIASILSIGWVGVVVSGILVLAMIFFCYSLLRPALIKTPRGITILDAIRDVGLVDIENRDKTGRQLPPEQFYQTAEKEIVITSITAHRTLTQHIDILKQALKDGKRIYFLMFHPQNPRIGEISRIDGKDVLGELQQAISIIKQSNLYKHRGFQLKFLKVSPPFTAVMIDGDIEPLGDSPQDEHGQIRVQPHTMYLTKQCGIIFQVKKKLDKSFGAFDYYAQDLRVQWSDDGIEDSTLLEEKSS